MKRFMVVYHTDGKDAAAFFDDRSAAAQFKMNVECGVGGYAEVYKRSDKRGGEYKLLYA